MILFGIFIWALYAGHPWVAFFLATRLFIRFLFALVATSR
jgi:hypothetical protein